METTALRAQAVVALAEAVALPKVVMGLLITHGTLLTERVVAAVVREVEEVPRRAAMAAPMVVAVVGRVLVRL